MDLTGKELLEFALTQQNRTRYERDKSEKQDNKSEKRRKRTGDKTAKTNARIRREPEKTGGRISAKK